MIRTRRRRAALVAGLLLLAPTIGEFLLGNIPISQYPSVLLLVPLYGCGALLVRELVRRSGLGWPAMALFAAAYALVEEGLVDQMVYNPGYLGLDSFAGYAEIPGLGISLTLVLYSLALHTVWSICVPIALMEAFDAEPQMPWLGRFGLGVVLVVFVGGCVCLGVWQARDLDFVGTPLQFGVTVLAVAGLVVTGFSVASQPPGDAGTDATAPAPWVAGVTAFAVTSLYWLGTGIPGTLAALTCFALGAGVCVALIRRWSGRCGWSGRHRVALATGAAATYALWFGPSQAYEAGTGPGETAAGAGVFGIAVGLVALVGSARQRL